jgi:hypothetical protein
VRRKIMAKYKNKASRTNTPWTDADYANLRAMYAAGMSKWDISKELDRSPGAVQAQVYTLGLHKIVSDALTSQDATKHVSSVTTTSTLKRWWNRLMGKEN